MKQPHEITPTTAIEIDDPSRFWMLKQIHRPTPVETRGGTDTVSARIDRGLLFIEEDDGYWMMKFDRREMPQVVELFTLYTIEEITQCGWDIHGSGLPLDERIFMAA